MPVPHVAILHNAVPKFVEVCGLFQIVLGIPPISKLPSAITLPGVHVGDAVGVNVGVKVFVGVGEAVAVFVGVPNGPQPARSDTLSTLKLELSPPKPMYSNNIACAPPLANALTSTVLVVYPVSAVVGSVHD